MLFPAFVQSHILKWVATVSSFVFVSLLLVNPSLSFSNGSDVSADFLYNNDGMIIDDNTIDVTNIALSSQGSNDKKPFLTYILKPGDSLSKVAQDYGVSVSQVKSFNNIVDETSIRPGQTLFISQTPWFAYTVQNTPTSLMVFTNMYDLDETELMRVNAETNPLKPYKVGDVIIVPNKTLAQAYSMWLLKEPIKPEVKTIKPIIARAIPWRTNTSSPVRGPVRVGSANNKILKSRRYTFNENNGMTPWYCTYYAAHKVRRLFPLVKGKTYFRWVKGNANLWISSAQAGGLKTSKTPSVGAVVVFGRGGMYNPTAWHVAVVIGVDREKKTMTVEEMNYLGRNIVNQRIISMNDSMTESTSSSQGILWFIPVQALSKKLDEQYQALLK